MLTMVESCYTGIFNEQWRSLFIMHRFLFLETITFPLPEKRTWYPKLLLRCPHVQLNHRHIPYTLWNKCSLIRTCCHLSLACKTLKLINFFPVQRILIFFPLQSFLLLPPSQLLLSTNLLPQMATPFSKAMQIVQEYQN